MSTNGSPSKKRKQDSQDNEGQGAVKSVKLEVNNDTDGAGSDGSDSGSEDESLSSVPTPKKISPSLPPLVTSPASRNLNGGVPAPLPSTHQQRSLPRPGIPPQQTPLILDLQRGNVASELLRAFAEERLPDKITYNGSSFNLHKAFEMFWSEFYHSTDYSKGKCYKKLPNDELSDQVLLAIAKILRRGWEDERYFPKRIHDKFLEACIFNRKELKNAMSLSVKSKTINLWTHELVGLLELEEFRFLMARRRVEDDVEMVEIERGEAPHQRWSTFHFGWSPDKVEYYFRMLKNDALYWECNLCGNTDFDYFYARHFLGQCLASKKLMQTERHDCALRKIHQELESAIERRVPYFREGNWKTIVMYGNLFYEWPKELGMLKYTNKYPHLITYSVSPKKKALIIEPTVAWEGLLDYTKAKKIEDHSCFTRTLESDGFEVQFEPIVLGNRGVPSKDLYTLFDQVFSMKH